MSKMHAFKLILKWGIYRSPLQLIDRVNTLAAETWGLEQNANGHGGGLRKTAACELDSEGTRKEQNDLHLLGRTWSLMKEKGIQAFVLLCVYIHNAHTCSKPTICLEITLRY